MGRPPLDRLLGLETEYAIRFLPEATHPGNDAIFEALREALEECVAARPGRSAPGREQFFVQNGGAFYYEFLPYCMWGGLIEGATPECRGPAQLLLYQRAQEALLNEAIPRAEDILRRHHFPGRIGLLKNSRDAEGNVYGSQENYETDIARGPWLAFYRLGLLLLLPILTIQLLLTLAVFPVLLLGIIVFALAIPFVPSWRRRFIELAEGNRTFEASLGRFHMRFLRLSTWPVVPLFSLLLRGTAFRQVRRRATAFLVSRMILVGTGALADGRRFELSEKASAVSATMRSSIVPENRPIFDTGNLIKMLCAPLNAQFAPLGRLFKRRQRLQLGFADSNRSQVAEYLRIGTTSLVLDMIDDHALDDAPELADPLAALHAVARDPSLETCLPLSGGGEMSALELQRFYHERARRYVRQRNTASLEAREVVRLWGEVLEALGRRDFGSLVGRLDWVTKRYLLERCGTDADEATLKTLALRYHELGEGSFDRLEQAGETKSIVDGLDVVRATREPPENTPAFLRGGLIRRQAGEDVPVVVSWDAAHVGPRLRAKVVPFRPRRGNDGPERTTPPVRKTP